MKHFFPPTPQYPKNYDSDYTLYLVYNTSETVTTAENFPWADEIIIKPVEADQEEIWADNGFANIAGELFYYDDVEKDSITGKVYKFIRCARNLGGTHTKHNPSGSEVRGFVIAEHYNQIVDVILNIEDFVGENFSTDTATLDWRIRHLQSLPVIFDDFTCPDISFDFVITSDDPATGIVATYTLAIDGSFSSFVLDFGDGTFTTSATSGTHTYAVGTTIDPVITISNSKCTIVQTPITRTVATQPTSTSPNTAFEIPIGNIPTIPKFDIPTIPIPSLIPQLPQIVFPCVDFGPINTDVTNIVPSVIQFVPAINIPSVILFENLPNFPTLIEFINTPVFPSVITFANPPVIPTLINFGPVTVPTLINFGPVNIPTLIDFGPVSIPTLIEFGPVSIPTLIDFGPVSIPTLINFGPVSIPTLIDFGPVSIPTLIEFGPVSIPTLIEFGPVSIPTLIEFGPVSIPTLITFGPAPTIIYQSIILFGPAPTIPTLISFGPAPTIATKISFGAAPAIPTSITVNFGPVPSLLTNIIKFGPPPYIPTMIKFGPAPTIATKVTFGPGPTFSNISFATPPQFSTIKFGPAPSIPNVSFGPAPGFSRISFGPAPSIPNVSFGPAPSIPAVQFGTPPSIPPIQFGPAPSMPRVSFGTPPSISVAWGTPPTVSCSCTMTVSCPSPFRSQTSLPELTTYPEDDTLTAQAMDVQMEQLGIPSEIIVKAPNIPDIRILHDIPAMIRLDVPEIPDIRIIGPETPLPKEIKIVSDNLPSTIELLASNLPKSIMIDAINIPKSILLEVPKELPSIKIDASGIPKEIKVVGVPDTIELVGPSEIKLVLPEKPEVELVYKGAPIDVKINLDVSRLTGENGKQCVAIVPCDPGGA
jgi:hypothetical protein